VIIIGILRIIHSRPPTVDWTVLFLKCLPRTVFLPSHPFELVTSYDPNVLRSPDCDSSFFSYPAVTLVYEYCPSHLGRRALFGLDAPFYSVITSRLGFKTPGINPRDRIRLPGVPLFYAVHSLHNPILKARLSRKSSVCFEKSVEPCHTPHFVTPPH